MQFGMLRHARLDEQRRLRRIDTRRQPVDHHVPHAFFDHLRRIVMRGQRMPVRHEKQALVFVLQLHPVFQHAVIMAQMQSAGWTHARNNAIRIHSECEKSKVQNKGASDALLQRFFGVSSALGPSIRRQLNFTAASPQQHQ